jgi:uncharacterized glyoxalase superfamily protein PhnB
MSDDNSQFCLPRSACGKLLLTANEYSSIMSTMKLDAIGIIVADLSEAVAFYRLLGLDFPAPQEDDQHIEASTASGLRIMLDTEELIAELLPDWTPPTTHRIGLAFLCDSAEEVDVIHQRIVDAGYTSAKAPFDAFWGQRYASVADPSGNVVDLFAPLG